MVFRHSFSSRQAPSVETSTSDDREQGLATAGEGPIDTPGTAANEAWRDAGPSRAPDTAEQEVTLQQAGGLLKADVILTAHRGETVVCKDYRRWQHTALAPLARYLMKREARMLRHLRDWAHAPDFKGFAGRYAFYMSAVDGMDLGEAYRRSVAVRYGEIQRMMGELHRFDVTHNDLRWTNILVRYDGRLVLIDFASAFHATPRSPLRPVMNRLRRSDMAGTLKFKRRLTGRALTPTEQRLKATPRWLSLLRRGWKHQVLPRLKGR
ncbi:lipopolysaccharide kinase InaA family protein [Kushneria sp. TE3]|uniref:lipopolysaccharide kinase InaA family protein n=1 Tax=Kushneria sp. TE3 TaxID=3449832 RepID=UPI003F6879E9